MPPMPVATVATEYAAETSARGQPNSAASGSRNTATVPIAPNAIATIAVHSATIAHGFFMDPSAGSAGSAGSCIPSSGARPRCRRGRLPSAAPGPARLQRTAWLQKEFSSSFPSLVGKEVVIGGVVDTSLRAGLAGALRRGAAFGRDALDAGHLAERTLAAHRLGGQQQPRNRVGLRRVGAALHG